MKYYNGYWACYLDSDSLNAMDNEYKSSDVTIFTDNKELFNGIDFTRTCYVTATVQFGNPLLMCNTPADPKSCFAHIPDFKIVEIKN